jgi:hypothetical protein
MGTELSAEELSKATQFYANAGHSEAGEMLLQSAGRRRPADVIATARRLIGSHQFGAAQILLTAADHAN